MKVATISQAKNRLSELLRAVRGGETVVILDRKVPIARLERVEASGWTDNDFLMRLVRAGIAAPPRRKLDVAKFLKMPRGKLSRGASAVAAVVADREESL
jgi:antitoxin (DNA-binding transcriptional repressor) of toxin-antitoxin stability system